MRHYLLGVLIMVVFGLRAQVQSKFDGTKSASVTIYAFTNATIYLDYQTKLTEATLLVQGRKIIGVGSDIQIPDGAIVEDLSGKFIYPGFFDPFTHYGLPAAAKRDRDEAPQYDSERGQAFGWNDHLHPEYAAIDEFSIDGTEALAYKKNGFTNVLTYKKDGIVAGVSSVVNLNTSNVNEAIVSDKVAQHFSYAKGSSDQEYPSSLMGIVALIRQTYYDADWYAKAKPEEFNLTMSDFNENKTLPQVFEAPADKLKVLLADKIGDEFGVQYIIKGNGDEYQRLDAIKATGAPLILPLDFPKAYDVSDPLQAADVSLAEMKHWEMAPYNVKMLLESGVEVALTLDGLKDKSQWLKLLRKLKETGLTETEILKAITFTPAKYFGLEEEIGLLKTGNSADFFITDQPILEEKAQILETWAAGDKSNFVTLDLPELAGNYDLIIENDTTYQIEIKKEGNSFSATYQKEKESTGKIDLKIASQTLVMTFEVDDKQYRLSGWFGDDSIRGIGEDNLGNQLKWSVKPVVKDAKDEEEKKEEEENADEIGQVIYPFVAHGNVEVPDFETILIKNATVWTMEDTGVLEETDVLVKDGKIAQIGKHISIADAKVIDGTGMHLSPGIIDEHSHIALFTVNEATQAVTAEVRMEDVVNSDDINIYRNLAGGVTTAQLLHGSANPVGGQSAIIKMRWGATPSDLKFQEAAPFIKFALGENVKQSNWGAAYSIRFPQTRMGVEQVYMDAFNQAKAYGEAKVKYEALSKKEKVKMTAPRKDLRLETLLQIIQEERFITCHSYVQSEINMLMKVAEQFDFKINTFTHILEGYKVADKMAEHGAGGSTFADWWAYKFEVKDAIPYNAALMTMAGVTTAINSDDAEMSRRLNQEAAKMVKYGGVTEEQALAMVTINPARLLHVDDVTGSIKVGKMADLVLWTNHPLSIYARVAYTMVDGKIYYSKEKDQEARAYQQAERIRLMNKMKAAKASGAPTQKPKEKEAILLHCDS